MAQIKLPVAIHGKRCLFCNLVEFCSWPICLDSSFQNDRDIWIWVIIYLMKRNLNMKKRLILGAILSVALFASIAIASTLMGQWTEGTSRYCEYSDGTVIEISFGSTCPASN